MLEGHLDDIETVAFSHNSMLIASGSSRFQSGDCKSEVMIWDTEKVILQQRLSYGDSLESVAFSYNSRLMLLRSYKAIEI